MNHYVRSVSANPLKAFIGISVLAICGVLLVFTDSWTVLRVLLALAALWFLLLRPELALAIQFNGVALYLYAIYKLKIETSTVGTGSFYGAMALAYLAGGWHLAMGRRFLKLNRIDALFILLYSLFFISYALFSQDNPEAYRKVYYAPLLVIAPYFGLQLLSSSAQVRRFFFYCALLAVIMILPSFYELLANPFYLEYGRFSIFIFADKGDNPIQFGIAFATLLIVLIFHIAEQRKLKLWHVLLMLPSIYLMVRSGARGPLISFVVVLLTYVMWLSGMRARNRWLMMGGLAILLVAAFRFVPSNTFDMYQALVDPSIGSSRDPSANSIQERIILMDLAIKEFLEHPLIGVGTGNSSGGIGYPHNAWVEVAAEFGILGLAIFSILCGVVITMALTYLRGAPKGRDDWLMNLAFSVFIFAWVEALFSAYMGGDMLLYGSMGMVSVVAKITEQEARERELQHGRNNRERSYFINEKINAPQTYGTWLEGPKLNIEPKPDMK